MKSPAEMLTAIGIALHGPDHWKMRLARDLGIDDDTLRRWVSGRTPLSPTHGVFQDALALLERRGVEISDVEGALKEWLERAP